MCPWGFIPHPLFALVCCEFRQCFSVSFSCCFWIKLLASREVSLPLESRFESRNVAEFMKCLNACGCRLLDSHHPTARHDHTAEGCGLCELCGRVVLARSSVLAWKSAKCLSSKSCLLGGSDCAKKMSCCRKTQAPGNPLQHSRVLIVLFAT